MSNGHAKDSVNDLLFDNQTILKILNYLNNDLKVEDKTFLSPDGGNKNTK